MDNQQFFDECVTRLIAQGQPSTNKYNCMYRGPNGTKCAVGQFIPDDEFDRKPEESTSVSWAINQGYWPTINKLAETVTPNFIRAMQAAHDGLRSYPIDEHDNTGYFTNYIIAQSDRNWLENFKKRATQVGAAWGLNTGVLDNG